ncbi:MAG: site-specific integrase [Chitinophagaceae bacterium]|nr:MAG: site-specific integrase [Chitinophagaceae bacterium]
MPLKIYRRPGEDIWQYTGTVAGRRLRGSTKTTQKSEAQRTANEVESRELQRGRDPGSVLTFADAAIEYRKMGKTPKYLEMVEDHWKDTPVRDITRGALKRAAITLLPNGSGAYRNRAVLVPTQAVINHCADLDMCAPLRASRFHEPKRTKEPATWEWVQAFMAHSSPHLGALACFMFLTGARISEALGVTWGRLDLTNGRVIISMGKLGGEERVAHMPPELVAVLANIPSNRESDSQVFPYAAGDSVSYPWQAAVKRAGIKRVTPHGCRHGFATGLMHQGVDPITVAKRGGWKSPAQLFATYGHAMDDETVTNLLTGTPKAKSNIAASKVLKYNAK